MKIEKNKKTNPTLQGCMPENKDEAFKNENISKNIPTKKLIMDKKRYLKVSQHIDLKNDLENNNSRYAV